MGSHLCVGFLVAMLVLTFLPSLRAFRKTTKESLAQTSSAITESLMGISRMMSQQVQQSEEAMQTLGKAGSGEGRFSQRLRLQSPCSGPSTSARRLGPQLTDLCVWLLTSFTAWSYPEWDMLLLFLFGFYSCTTGPAHAHQNDSPAEVLPGAGVKSRDPQALSGRVGASSAGEGPGSLFSRALGTHVAGQV